MLMTKLSRELYRELEEKDRERFEEGIKRIMADGGNLETTLKILKEGIEEKDALPFATKITKELWKKLEGGQEYGKIDK